MELIGVASAIAKEGITKLTYRSLNIGMLQGNGKLISHMPRNGIIKLAMKYLTLALFFDEIEITVDKGGVWADLIQSMISNTVGNTAMGILVNFHRVK